MNTRTGSRHDEPATAVFTVTEAHVDWLTVTASQGIKRRLLDELCLQVLAERERTTGEPAKAWRWQGFDGTRCGQFSWGSRPDCSVALASGALAATHWRRLSAVSQNCSRLDLAVTVEVDDESRDLAREALEQYKRFKAHTPNSATWTLYTSEGGGTTLYLGRRTSDLFFRLYNKHAEDAEHYPRPAWRYELELKRKAALEALRYLVRERDTSRAILAALTDYLARRGINRPWREPDAQWHVSAPRLPATQESRLHWLRTQVAPAIQELLLSYDTAAVLEALGLWTGGHVHADT